MFSFGKNAFVGLDIGSSAIKIVEIKLENNRPVLSNYAWMDLVDSQGKPYPVSFEATLPEYLKKILKEAKIKKPNVYFSVPAAGALIALIEFPEIAEEDLNQAVRFEAHKYIPTSLDEVVLSWDVVSRPGHKASLTKNANKPIPAGEGQGKMQVLLVAAPKNKIVKYEMLTKNSGMDLKSLEIESFSLVRSLIGNDLGNFLIVDIGEKICNIILAEKGIIKVSRNIEAGGRDFTRAIARNMSVDESRAEKMKCSGKNFFDVDSNLSFPVLDIIVGEIKRVLSAYYKNEAESQLQGIILTGGMANLPGLDKYFQEAIKTKVTIANSLGRLEVNPKLATKLKEINNRFSVAVGLALKGVEEYLRK